MCWDIARNYQKLYRHESQSKIAVWGVLYKLQRAFDSKFTKRAGHWCSDGVPDIGWRQNNLDWWILHHKICSEKGWNISKRKTNLELRSHKTILMRNVWYIYTRTNLYSMLYVYKHERTPDRWEPERCYHYSTIFHWKPEGGYRFSKSMVIAAFRHRLVLNRTSLNSVI